ncbi:phospholipase D-like domain-containing protein [Granulosicoccus sp. 3-233]|uniref:phospholipase D-like domain-containing protein n=1 Tax=Granulosicoccus sp. 3-233 TaxID=3417969 RepID=UPI003D328E7D
MSKTCSTRVGRFVHLLALTGGAWLLWSIYTLVVPEPEDLLPDSLDRVKAAAAPVAGQHETPDLLTTLETVLHSPVTSGNQVEALINGDEIFPAMLSAISEARQSIHLLTYIYWSGQIAEEFAKALGQAVDRGVDVRLIIDGYGARTMPSELFNRLESSGVQVVWFHPFTWYNIRHFNRRTHRKVMIVDNTVAFTGGVGIAQEWTGNARNADEWRDDHFRIEGPAVRMLAGSFAENWLNATGKLMQLDAAPQGEGSTKTPKPDNDDGARLMVLSTSPRGDLSPVALSYWTALQLATHSVNIATPYFVPDAALARALLETADRGVSVRLLLPGDYNDSWLARYASLAFYQDLVGAGIAVHEYQPTMMHTKAMVIDDRWSLFGSPNFDNRSFELNDEILVLADDVKLAKSLNASFEADLEQARLIALNGSDLTDRIGQWAAHVLLIFREQI